MGSHYTYIFPNLSYSFVKELIYMVSWSSYKQSLRVHEGKGEINVYWVPTILLNLTLVLRTDSAFICIFALRKWRFESESHLVVSDSLRPQGLDSPWNSPGQNTGMGSLSLLQGSFPIQGLNAGLPHCRHILYQLSHKGSPRILEWMLDALCQALLKMLWMWCRSSSTGQPRWVHYKTHLQKMNWSICWIVLYHWYFDTENYLPKVMILLLTQVIMSSLVL